MKSVRFCSRKFLKRGELVSSPDFNIVRGYGWTTQAASHCRWQSGPSEQEDFRDSAAEQFGEARQFICSSPISCKEGGGREISQQCQREIIKWITYLSSWCHRVCNGEPTSNKPICNVLQELMKTLYTFSFIFIFQSEWSVTLQKLETLSQDKFKFGTPSCPQTFFQKHFSTVVKREDLPIFERTDPKDFFSCLKCPKYYDTRKRSMNFTIETDKLYFVVYRYGNNVNVKGIKVDPKFKDHKTLLAKWVYIFSYIDIFLKRCIDLDETVFLKETIFIKNECFLSTEHFPVLLGKKLTFEFKRFLKKNF